MNQDTPLPSWHQQSPLQVASSLGVNLAQGLDSAQVRARQALFGFNALPQSKPPSFWQLAWRQAHGVVVMLLLVAAALSLALGETADAAAILAALLLNAGVGLAMDFRAEKAFSTLQEATAPLARARRSGLLADLAAREVVPGDVLLLMAGDRSPADGRLVEGYLQVDESLLTGESVPVQKSCGAIGKEQLPLAERTNEVFAGTLITAGKGTLVVTNTAGSTEIGRIGRLLAQAPSHASMLAKRLDVLGRRLLWMVAALALVLIAIGLFQRRPFFPLMETAVVLAIAAIPEGLPAVATLALAAGAHRLTRFGVFLRKLSALEALGNIDVLCLDKTGTLTANAMTIRSVHTMSHALHVSGEGFNPVGELTDQGTIVRPQSMPELAELLRAGQLCNDAVLETDAQRGWHIHGDPSEGALLVLAKKAALADPRLDNERVYAQSTGADRPWMTVVYRDYLESRAYTAYIKGAPEIVLSHCRQVRMGVDTEELTGEHRQLVLRQNRQLAQRAMRVLAVATKALGESWQASDLEDDWIWLGLVGMVDPPRPEVDRVLALTHRAGIRTLMITGDQQATAAAIAGELNLAAGKTPKVVSGAEEVAPDVDVYARATPVGKLKLVEALQASGHLPAMTGDGINDAPALRTATVGIAMGRGADVAKEAADAVLTDERLSTLLEGVREGRAVFLNIQKGVDFLLTCSVATQLVVLLTAAAGLPLPLLPLQILYLNLLTHTFPALGLTLEPASPQVMEQPPLPRTASLLPMARIVTILWHGLVIALATIAVGTWALQHADQAHSRTLIFATLATALMLHAGTDRSVRPFGGWRWGKNPALFGFMFTAVALQWAAIYLPPLSRLLSMTGIDKADWLSVLVAAAISLVAIEASKWALVPKTFG